MLIKIQAYYCCWTELVKELKLQARDNTEVEVQFFGNSRHHYEGCPESNRRKDTKKTTNVFGQTPFGSINLLDNP